MFFSDRFRKVILRYRRTGFNLNVMGQSVIYYLPFQKVNKKQLLGAGAITINLNMYTEPKGRKVTNFSTFIETGKSTKVYINLAPLSVSY